MIIRSGSVVLLLILIGAAGFGVGVGWMWWTGSGSGGIDSPANVASLLVSLAEQRNSEAADRYALLQDKLRVQEEEAAKAVQQTMEVRVKAEARLTLVQSDMKAQIVELEEREQVVEKEIVFVEKIVEKAVKDNPEAAAALVKLEDYWQEKFSIVEQERDYYVDLTKALDKTLTAYRAETETLSLDNQILRKQFAAAEERIDDLEGFKVRWGPTALVGLGRGIDGGWAVGPSFGLGVTATW